MISRESARERDREIRDVESRRVEMICIDADYIGLERYQHLPPTQGAQAKPKPKKPPASRQAAAWNQGLAQPLTLPYSS